MNFYMKPIGTCYAQGCNFPIREEVYNNRNELYGRYCIKHAQAKIKELNTKYD